MKTKNLDAWHKQVSASMPGYKETYPKILLNLVEQARP